MGACCFVISVRERRRFDPSGRLPVGVGESLNPLPEDPRGEGEGACHLPRTAMGVEEGGGCRWRNEVKAGPALAVQGEGWEPCVWLLGEG